jgi:hypothetical protein
MNAISPHFRQAAWLGALLLAAILPADTLAAVGGSSGTAPRPGAGRGRRLYFRLHGRTRVRHGGC